MKREETVDYNIKTAWHAINRMYNQEALKNDITTSIGFVLLNINSTEGTPATKIAPLIGSGIQKFGTHAEKYGRKGIDLSTGRPGR